MHVNLYRPGMNISLLHFDGCPNWKLADERLGSVVAERPDVRLSHVLVDSVEEAERLGFRGSPSILVDGVDPFDGGEGGVGLACRIYQTPDGPAGSPTADQLRAVILGG